METQLATLERALAEGKLLVQATNGKWYRLRRNGKTQRWKTRPEDYRVPCKWAFRSYFQLTPKTVEFTRVIV